MPEYVPLKHSCLLSMCLEKDECWCPTTSDSSLCILMKHSFILPVIQTGYEVAAWVNQSNKVFSFCYNHVDTPPYNF